MAANLIVATALLALLTTPFAADGRRLGAALAHRMICAVSGGCDDEDAELRRAYGARDAALVREHLPGLVYEPGERQVPVDWRDCRDVGCAEVDGDDSSDVHRSASGEPVTVFTRVHRRDGRRYIQYWFYYPDSNTTFANSDRIWRHSRLLQLGGLALRGTVTYPGYHRDDWEGAAVRVEADGAASTRVTSHGHWQWCKWSRCKEMWGPATGWLRVSRGSHAGHVPVEATREWSSRRSSRTAPWRYERQLPGVTLDERTTSPDAVRLVPLETLDRRSYRRLDDGIAPPWQKQPYRDPESPES